ncbi:aromatic-ring hydroxylase C-terminal domain-containing protein [Streptomyces sp. DH10]|uniref:aromatic-ring hydroxylase C-terminal domain-containing protein n=1 Tax=Streptomyces sp. DH10 TaxID=3040121 RepID=UPI002441F9FC|nr:hypothetical protein [Streptomyces sp. DH10]MDG9711199.1 hypothetical protein [Streptomyces sp. DH10]
MPDIQLADDVWAGEPLRTGCGVLLTVDSAFVDGARPWSDRVEAVPLPENALTGEDADAFLIRPGRHHQPGGRGSVANPESRIPETDS